MKIKTISKFPADTVNIKTFFRILNIDSQYYLFIFKIFGKFYYKCLLYISIFFLWFKFSFSIYDFNLLLLFIFIHRKFFVYKTKIPKFSLRVKFIDLFIIFFSVLWILFTLIIVCFFFIDLKFYTLITSFSFRSFDLF